MKHSFLPKWDEILKQIRRVGKHYPLTMAVCITVALLLVWSVAFDTGFTKGVDNDTTRNIFALTLLVPVTFTARVYAASYGSTKKTEGILLGTGLLLVLVIRFTTFPNMHTPGVLAFVTGLFAFIFLAVAAAHRDRSATLEQNSVTFVTSVLVSALYSIVLMIGLFIVLATVQFLFDASVEKGYSYSAIFCIVLCFPFLFLARMTPETVETNYPTILRQTVLFIFLPLSIVYVLILYAYSVQFITRGVWERSIASNLIIWFGMFCLILDFLVRPLRESSSLAKRWSCWMPLALIPLLGFALMTMSMRILQYRWTELRYLGIVLTVFALIVQIGKTFTPRFTGKRILAGLAAVLLLTATGPVSAGSVSLRSQTKRLKERLAENQMLSDGSVVAGTSVSQEDQQQITDILRYLDSNHGFGSVGFLPPDFTMNQMESVFGFAPFESYWGGSQIWVRRPNTPLDLNDFDYLVVGPSRTDWPMQSGELTFRYEQNRLRILKGSDTLVSVDLPMQPAPSEEIINTGLFPEAEGRIPFSGEGITGEVILTEGWYDQNTNRWDGFDFFVLYSLTE